MLLHCLLYLCAIVFIQVTSYRLHIFIHQQRFIMISLYGCNLSQVEGKKNYKKNVFILLFSELPVPVFFSSSCGFQLLSSVLSFQLGLSLVFLVENCQWYFRFYFSVISLLFPLFLIHNVTGNRIFGWYSFFFFFSTLNMLSHCLLASMVCDDNATVNLDEDSLNIMIHFDLDASKILSLALAFSSLTMVYFVVDYFEFILLWVCLAIWMCRFMFFIKLGKFFNHFS